MAATPRATIVYAPAESVGSPEGEANVPPPGTETILLVEDEPEVRELILDGYQQVREEGAVITDSTTMTTTTSMIDDPRLFSASVLGSETGPGGYGQLFAPELLANELSPAAHTTKAPFTAAPPGATSGL